jgi:ankyrin repeat protein
VPCARAPRPAPPHSADLGHADVASALLDGGDAALVNAAADNGWTALHFAAWRGHAAMVRLLLARGADQRRANARGFTAAHKAAERGHAAVAALLCAAAGAEEALMWRDPEQFMTPLALANLHGHVECAAVLRARGAPA